ncbi:MAG: T9SS C-terminal target domain-containing protein [Cytophagales bacterium]|nr:MAG: T9SS C-terminal target domain-containing protein [Cytophagales bacterium]
MQKLLYRFLFFHLALFCSSLVAFCQERRCDSVIDSSFTSFNQEIELLIAKKKKNQHRLRTEETVYVIPVVFHIIHNGEPMNQGLNLSMAQVYSQFEVLNQDFRRRNSDSLRTPKKFGGVAADTKIEFALARIDPLGVRMKEIGIHRYNGGRNIWNRTDFEALVKPPTIWNPTEYLNIWVTDLSGLLGYSKFPTGSGLQEGGGWEQSPNGAVTDGVVIDFQAFGSNKTIRQFNLRTKYSLGRTLTHEIGHFLGLIHISGDGGCEKDDFCEDTPLQDGNSYDCKGGLVSCGAENMVQNYMDYSDDTCMNLFTKEQALRMKTVLENSIRRKELLLSKVAIKPVNPNPANSILLFPNPAIKFVNIDYDNITIQSYLIYNQLGQILRQQQVSEKLYTIDFDGLSAGLYFMVFYMDKKIEIQKLLLLDQVN